MQTSIRNLHAVFCLAAISLLFGCEGKIYTKPYAATANSPYTVVCGDVQYSGDKQHLPSTVANCRDNSRKFVIEYSYEQDNVGTSTENELAYKILLPIGTPTGVDKVLVFSHMNVFSEGKDVARYSATCVKEYYRSIFFKSVDNAKDTVQCLDALKVNIESQMMRDELFWKARVRL